MLAVLWVLPLLYAFWTAFHPAEFADQGVTLTGAVARWRISATPGRRRRSRGYFLNTTILVTIILVAQFVLCTPAAFAFAPRRVPWPQHRLRAWCWCS
jgi:sn-glycerol 3-phosphate transport system permease protein